MAPRSLRHSVQFLPCYLRFAAVWCVLATRIVAEEPKPVGRSLLQRWSSKGIPVVKKSPAAEETSGLSIADDAPMQVVEEDVTYLSEDVSAEWVEGAAEAAEEVLEEQEEYLDDDMQIADDAEEGEGAEGSGSQAEASPGENPFAKESDAQEESLQATIAEIGGFASAQVKGFAESAKAGLDAALSTLPEWPIGRIWAAAAVIMLILAKLIGCGCGEQRQGANRLLRQQLGLTLLALLVLGGFARVAQQSGQLPEVWVFEASEAIMAFVAAFLAMMMVVLLCMRALLFRRWSVYEEQGAWEPLQATMDAGGRVRLKRNPKTCRYWAMKASFQDQCGLPENFNFSLYLSESFMLSTMNLMELSWTSFFTILLPAILELGMHVYFARHYVGESSASALRIFSLIATYSTLLLHVHILVRINRKVLPVSEQPGSHKVEPQWAKGVRRMAQALTVFDLVEVSNFGAQMWHGIGPFAGMQMSWLLALGLPVFVNLFVMIPLIVEWLSFVEACDAPHEEIIEFVSCHVKKAAPEDEIASALGLQSVAPLHQLFMKCEPDKDGIVHASDFFQRMKEQYFGSDSVIDDDNPLMPRKAG
mmetsp:Transcript_56811/g.133422  ORF Transcript_56811/g.133422 Transcript_56811/m.133422 type:complete len:590 (+) Transcript_56811:119-1888(+)